MHKIFSAEDICLYQTVSALDSCASNGLTVCEVTSVDLKSDSQISAIWAIPTAGGEPYQFTNSQGSESAPSWSPDGEYLAFVSTRNQTPQIFTMPASGGEARQLTNFPSGVSTFEW